jgi:hypothetical protein
MIPPFNTSLVLPPFTGDDPGQRATMSPYKTDVLTVVRRFATTQPRGALLSGLLDYRKALRSAGVVSGFQWIDGSFVENVEITRGRPPGDIDLVTFAPAPDMGKNATDEEFNAWVEQFGWLFDPDQAKAQYGCEAFFIDILKRPDLLIDDTRYWFGLFSHQRATSLWKGMIQVPMKSNDDEAREYLSQLGLNFEEANDA